MDHQELRSLEDDQLLLSVRHSPDLIAYFKSTGDGWPFRMDGLLKQCVEKQLEEA